jgi:hypothetical protein
MPVGLLPVSFQNYSVNQWVSGGVPPSKLLIATPLFGRTYILEDPNNHGLGAPTTGSGPPGSYTGESGLLAYYEVYLRVFL